MSTYDFIISISLGIGAKLYGDAAAKLTRRMNVRDDGRYPFHIEMIHEGLIGEVGWQVDRQGFAHVVDGGGRVLAAVERKEQLEDLEGKWRGLCRSDRLPDGRPGPYEMSSHLIESVEEARTWASEVSLSRYPIIVEAEKAAAVLAVLNA